jgi:hypothetical protein
MDLPIVVPYCGAILWYHIVVVPYCCVQRFPGCIDTIKPAYRQYGSPVYNDCLAYVLNFYVSILRLLLSLYNLNLIHTPCRYALSLYVYNVNMWMYVCVCVCVCVYICVCVCVCVCVCCAGYVDVCK